MVIGSFLSSGFKFVSYYDVCSNIVIIIMNFRFLRAGHKAGIACERHTREMEKAPLSTKVRFATDSALEEGGFELSVPRHGEVTAALRYAVCGEVRGTGSRAAGRNSASLRRSVIQPSARTLEWSLFTAEIGRQRAAPRTYAPTRAESGRRPRGKQNRSQQP